MEEKKNCCEGKEKKLAELTVEEAEKVSGGACLGRSIYCKKCKTQNEPSRFTCKNCGEPI